MKRTKQLQTVVDETNKYLRNNRIKDEADSAFNMVTWSLLQTKTYHGFNYYKDKTLADGTVISVLAGSDKDFDYLQIY